MKELALNILDIVQNSIRAKADEISISVTESITSDLYRITIADNGNGIPAEILHNVTDPFITTRTKRRMGMGLPLLKYHAEITGGGLTVNSEIGIGTVITATLSFKHIDRQPLGDIIGVLLLLMASNQQINFIYSHKTDTGEYRFSTEETKAYLEIDKLYERNLLNEIGGMIWENLKDINASGIEIKESYHEEL